jgi:hypothetical protein
MDIQRPEVESSGDPALLFMFCPEERIPRELFWAGFGFQVWCQMLTFVVKARSASLLVIDEPDIYLHSDLQRQLVGLLMSLGPDILIATHSTEIISEAEPDDLLIINKKLQSARRITDPSQLQSIFAVLGSNLNPTLTQLAKTRRVVYVEGKDFQVLSLFARKLGKDQVANRSDFAVVPVEGFNAQKVKDFSAGIAATLGATIAKAVVFDRDFRCEAEVHDVGRSLQQVASLAWIHKRKEIENYLLLPEAITKAVIKRLEERRRRTGEEFECTISVEKKMAEISASLKNELQGQYLAKRLSYEQSKNRHVDPATINTETLAQFEKVWDTFPSRLEILPGKRVLSKLNQFLQETYQVTVSPNSIIACLRKDEVPSEIVQLIEELDKFRSAQVE